jgi:hypothetical protein
MFEIFDKEQIKQEAYEKASADVGKDILALLKSGPADREAKDKIEAAQVRDLPAVKAELYQKALAEDIQDEIKKLNQKYHFGLDGQIVYEKSLERLLKQRSDGEVAADAYPDFSLVEDMYLNLFRQEVLAEYEGHKESGQDFSTILEDKANILREKNLISKEKIDSCIDSCYQQAYPAEKVA